MDVSFIATNSSISVCFCWTWRSQWIPCANGSVQLSGDSNETIVSVFEHLDTAESYAQAMLAGGKEVKGKDVPSIPSELKEEMEHYSGFDIEPREKEIKELKELSEGMISKELYESALSIADNRRDEIKELKDVIKLTSGKAREYLSKEEKERIKQALKK